MVWTISLAGGGRFLSSLAVIGALCAGCIMASPAVGGEKPAGHAGAPYRNMPDLAAIGERVDHYLPVPASDQAPPLDPAKGYRLQPLGRGLYMVTENAYQSMFMVYETGVVVVDAPPSYSKHIAAGHRGSHRSSGHSCGLQPLAHRSHRWGQRPWRQPDLDRALGNAPPARSRRGSEPAGADSHLRGRVHFEGRQPDARTQLPRRGARAGQHLHLGTRTEDPDGRRRRVPRLDAMAPFGTCAGLPGYFQQVAEIDQIPFEILVGGHVSRTGTHDDVRIQFDFMHDLKMAAATALKTTSPGEEMAASDTTNAWAVFDNYIDRVVVQCVNALTPKWQSRLAAYDVYIWDQCYAMEQSLRID